MSQERLPPLANIPAQIACLRDYEPYARQRMRAATELERRARVQREGAGIAEVDPQP